VEADLIAARNALRESDARFNTLADALPHMVWSSLPDGHFDFFNAMWSDFTGADAHSSDGEGWLAQVHPDDRAKVAETWRQSLATGEPYEIEYRLRERGDGYRWMLGRAQPVRNSQGRIVRWIGTWTDIHETKAHAKDIEILSRELSHRIKNIFAVINSLISMSARQAPEHREFAQQIRQRIAALGRAHEFVRPHSEESQQPSLAVTLHGLVAKILAPYPAFDSGRFSIEGDDMEVDDRSATPLALLVHELATNATKYGALGENGGRVALRTQVDGTDVLIEWREIDGPFVAGKPERTGFGTVLTEISIRDQMGGRLTREWDESGLRVIAIVPRANLLRGRP
jgi:PAS domain S-box-containing protein